MITSVCDFCDEEITLVNDPNEADVRWVDKSGSEWCTEDGDAGPAHAPFSEIPDTLEGLDDDPA